jgi:hypothetical protein
MFHLISGIIADPPMHSGAVSYGIMLSEVVSGRRNSAKVAIVLVVTRLIFLCRWRESSLRVMLDQESCSDVDSEEVETIWKLAC